MKIYAYVVIMLIVASALAGVYQAGKVSERVKYMEQIDSLKSSIEAQRIEYEKATNSLAAALLNRKPKRIKVYEKITNEIIKYVPKCDINYGAYGLLHAAASGGEQGYYSGLTDAEKKQLALTGTDYFKIPISWGKEYFDTVDQLHTLQEAVSGLSCVNKAN